MTAHVRRGPGPPKLDVYILPDTPELVCILICKVRPSSGEKDVIARNVVGRSVKIWCPLLDTYGDR